MYRLTQYRMLKQDSYYAIQSLGDILLIVRIVVWSTPK